MRLLDRYLFTEQLKIFVLTVLVLLMTLLLEKANVLSNLLLTKGASFYSIGEALTFLLPPFITLAAPLAGLMSSIMVFSRLSADNEITAMRAGGISLYRLLAPSILIALISIGVTLYMSLFMIHDSNLSFKRSVLNIMRTSLSMEIREQRFYSQFKDFVIHVNEKKEETLFGVFISDQRNRDRQRIIEAARGRITESEESDGVLFQLQDGVIHTIGDDGAYQTIAFNAYSLKLGFDKNLTGAIKKEAPDLSPSELLTVIDETNRKISEGENIRPPWTEIVALHQKFSIPLGCLALGLLGAPLGIMAHRRGASGGFGLGIVMIVTNYLLWTIGQGLGSEGKIHPIVGVWAPDVVMGGIGIYLILRVSKDTMPTRFGLWFGEKLQFLKTSSRWAKNA